MAGIRKRLGSLLGPDGRVPQLIEGDTAHVAPSEPARVSLTKTGDAEYRVDAQIPRGLDGDPTAVADFSQAMAREINLKDSAGRAALDAAFGNFLRVVYHGDNANYPRPDTPRPVMWIGTITPFNRAAGDLVPEVSSEPAPFTPADLDLLAWWDPSTLTSGSTVTSIADKGPRGIDLTTVGGTGDITVTDTALALPGLDNGGTAHMTTDPNVAVGLWDGAVTVYMVASLSDLPTVSNLFDNGSTMSVNRAAFWVNSGGRVQMTQGQTIQSDPYLVTADWPFLLAVTFTGGTDSRAELNGTIVTGPGDAGSNRPDSFRLFANLNGANIAPAVIGETIIARNVTAEQHADVTEYLQTKWGLI